MARGAMDEASPSAGGFRSQPIVRLTQRDQNVGPHASRLYRQNTSGSRRRTQSLSTLSQNPPGRAGVYLTLARQGRNQRTARSPSCISPRRGGEKRGGRLPLYMALH